MLTPEIHNPVLQWALIAAASVLGFAMIGAVYRVLRGPTLPDRVIALDMLGYCAIGVTGLYSIAVNRPALLSVAIVMALILFLGTAAFATYVERRARP